MPTVTETTLVAQAQWRRLDLEGTDVARLHRNGDGWRLSGRAAFTDGDKDWGLEYEVDCDSNWATREARVKLGSGTHDRVIRITRGADGQWSLDGTVVPAVAGCVDVDLAFTPATNLLSIRRLGLGIGEEREVIAAWLAYPEFTLSPLRQHYRRETRTTYDYRAPDVPFAGKLVVGPNGFVRDYAALWRQS